MEEIIRFLTEYTEMLEKMEQERTGQQVYNDAGDVVYKIRVLV